MSCSICLETLQSYTVNIVGCTHRHCISCFIEWGKQKHSCPICRKEDDQVEIYSPEGQHLRNCLISNLKVIKPNGCGLCFGDWTSFNVRPDCCGHHHCLKCFADWGRDECPTCGVRSTQVAIYNADGRYISWSYVSKLEKMEEDRWLEDEEEEKF